MMLLELAWVPLAAAAAQWEVAQDPPGRKQRLNKSQINPLRVATAGDRTATHELVIVIITFSIGL